MQTVLMLTQACSLCCLPRPASEGRRQQGRSLSSKTHMSSAHKVGVMTKPSTACKTSIHYWCFTPTQSWRWSQGRTETLDPQVKGLTKNVTSNFPEKNPTHPPHHPLGDTEVTNHNYIHTWYNVLSFYVHAEHCFSAISFTLLALIL